MQKCARISYCPLRFLRIQRMAQFGYNRIYLDAPLVPNCQVWDRPVIDILSQTLHREVGWVEELFVGIHSSYTGTRIINGGSNICTTYVGIISWGIFVSDTHPTMCHLITAELHVEPHNMYFRFAELWPRYYCGQAANNIMLKPLLILSEPL